MKVLAFGDVYGRIGRAGLKKELPKLKEKYNPDFIIANVENATSGRGPIEKHVRELGDLGIDVMTTGDHVFDNLSKIEDYLNEENSKAIRGMNFYENKNFKIPGKGYKVVEKNDKKLLVIHLIGEAFIGKKVVNPFDVVDNFLDNFDRKSVDGIIIDFHKEATAEGYGLGFFLDGKVSGIFGTHTHVQTNDDIILPKGTGFISDAGMNGPLYSVIGADYKSVEKRFITGFAKGKIEQCLDNNYLVSGVVFDINEKGKCIGIEKIKIKGIVD